MPKELNIVRFIAPYFGVFNQPLYCTFKALVLYFVEQRGQTLTGASLKASKSVSALSYFFNEGKWSAEDLLVKTRGAFNHRPQTRPRRTDLLCLDGSSLIKDGKSFELQTTVWDNADKRTGKGYEFCAAAIVTTNGMKYLWDYLLYTKKEADSEGKFQIWIRLIKKLVKSTKAWLFILDAGFRNKYFLSEILKTKRDFLIRLTPTMKLLLNTGKEIHLSKVRRGRPRVYQVGQEKIRVWEEVGVVKAWRGEIEQTLRIVLIQRDGFRNPLILCTSDLKSERIEVYRNYQRRWRIEELFLENKGYFNLEGFRVRKLTAIHRYLCCIITVHNILSIKLQSLQRLPSVLKQLEQILKKYRKIPKLLLGSLKKLYEMLAPPLFDLTLNPTLP